MPAVNEDIITNLLLGKDEVTPALKRAYAAGQNYAKFTQNLNTQNKAFNAGMDDFNKKLDESKKRFDMNALSWVFGGMALQRMGLTITRFFLPSMDKLEKINDKAAKKVMGIYAAFEFLKVSIFETLMQTPFFAKFVEWIIKAAIWVAEFAQKYPTILELSIAVGAIATALGTLAIGVGIYKQLDHLGTLLTSAKLKSSALLDALSKLGGAIAIGFSLKETWEDLMEGKFDPLGAAINSALFAMGLKLWGKAGWLKGGIIMFALTIGFEIALDPKGFGSFLADVANQLLKLADSIRKLGEAFMGDIGDMFSNLDFGFSGVRGVLKGWGEEFMEGYTQRLVELDKQGKLSQTLAESSTTVLEERFKTINELRKQSIYNPEGGQSWIKVLTGETNQFYDSFMSKMGNLSAKDTVIGKTSQFNDSINANASTFNGLKTNVDSWKPQDKHVNIYYHHINTGGGGTVSIPGNALTSSIVSKTSTKSKSSITG